MGLPLSGNGVAAPSAAEAAIFPLPFPGYEAGPTHTAFNPAAEDIAVGVSSSQGSLPVPAPELHLYHIPQLPVNNGFVVIPEYYQLLLSMVIFFDMREIVWRNCFLLDEIPHILFIF